MEKITLGKACFDQLCTAMNEHRDAKSLKEIRFSKLPANLGESVSNLMRTSNIRSLTKLSVSGNPDWWNSSDAFDALLAFLPQQTRLETFTFS